MAVLQRALTLPGGLDPSIVENTQVLQFAVHVKQRVPFAEQVASVESLCPASLLKHVKTHLFGQCASRQCAGKHSLQLRRSTCWIKVEAHLCICICNHIHVLICIICAFTHVLYTAHEIERPLSYVGLRLRGEAPIALLSGPSETSVNCGFVVSAKVGSELESRNSPSSIHLAYAKDRDRKQQKTVCFSLQRAKNIAVHGESIISRSYCGGYA